MENIDLNSRNLPDGVYLDLPDRPYFIQSDRLGSTDLSKLATDGYGWWWQSRYNPLKKYKNERHFAIGRALHKILLEGERAYEEAFIVEPDASRYDKVLLTISDMAQYARELERTPNNYRNFGKQDWLDWCRVIAEPNVLVWDNAIDDLKTLNPKKQFLTYTEHQTLQMLLQVILEDDSKYGEDVRKVLGYGSPWPVLSEVSFLWTDKRGIKRRARFDKLVPDFTLDIKSINNFRGREIQYAVPDHILKCGYDVQVGDQHMARLIMYEMLRERGFDCIHGGTDEQQGWLLGMAKQHVKFEWVWLFYQIPDFENGRAPIVFPLWENWLGAYHRSGHRKAYKAVETYIEGVKRFGLDRPWGKVMPVHYTKEGLPTSITLPYYGFDEGGAVEGEEELEKHG